MILGIIALVVLTMSFNNEPDFTVFMIGDSTMANKDTTGGKQERGWGMVLQQYFDSHVVVDNHAVNGRSTKSFINEGRWDKVLAKIKPGDYVFIQFGHNDEKPQPERHTDPGTTFDDNLRKFVNETRSKGGIPVLFNCVERRLFFDKNKSQPLATTNAKADDETLRDTEYGDEEVNTQYLVPTHFTIHGDYTVAPRLVAKKLNVPFIDANYITKIMEQDHGVVGSRKLHVWLKPGEVASIPKGRRDNTHYSVYGARTVSSLLVEAIGEKVPALKKYVRHYDYVVSKRGRGNFLSLDEAVAAVPENTKATILILDGEFTKPQTTKNIRYEVRSSAKLSK